VSLCVAVATLMATEQRGVVKSGGLPIPGAAVVAAKDGKVIATTTDDQGVYSFPNLEDGTWSITVEMLGFDKATRSVNVGSSPANLDLDLRLLPIEAAKPVEAGKVATESSHRTNPSQQSAPNSNLPARRQQPANAARPYQRLDVNATNNPAAPPGENGGEENGLATGDLNQSASEAMVVTGSLSSGVNAPQQNDWGFF